MFYISKNFELGRCLFFKDLFTLPWFLMSNWSSDFVHAETGSGAKKRVVFWREFFGLILK